MDFVKMERAVESAVTLMSILSTLYVINVFAKVVDIPPILVGSFLILFAVLFVLRAVIWKRNRDKSG